MKISLRIYIRNLFFITFLSQTLVALSQPYNNNWINYNQSYFKFKISENGLYSIDSLTLFNSGIPIGSIDPRNIQIFAKGVEIPLYIEGEGDGIFDNSDKIIFYALKNPLIYHQ